MKDIQKDLANKKRGPHVKVQFFVCDKGISKVILLPSSEDKGFEWRTVPAKRAPYVVESIEQWVGSYIKGCQPTVSLPIILEGLPPYTLRVLSILRELPIGVTLSYQELAEVTDNPLGARAVGNACARNPCPLIIPCHRVLAAKGGLGGFSGGADIKKILLEFEGVKI
jgi:methylated-DNA-[protein]-cysteine S-methyltransferase